jgi:lysophospholipase L1-like esterase
VPVLPNVWPQAQTIRQIVHATIGGTRARVVFTNVFGTTPLRIDAAALALRDKEATVVAPSSRPLTFSGQRTASIPAGAVLMSDPVELAIPANADLAVDLYSPIDMTTWPSALTVHGTAQQTSYLSARGNYVGQPAFLVAGLTASWFFLGRVDVEAPSTTSSVVALGDSITDGTASTRDANHRYPDQLWRRLQTASRPVAVLNEGIAGNRVLSEANPGFGINVLARLDRDLITIPGVRYVIVLEGINDIGMRPPSPSADDLIAGHRQLVERAHSAGLLIYGATLTPFEGAAYFTPEGEAKRQALNTWIRTSHVYDGVVDFDAAIRDPQQSAHFAAAYNSGDNLHPNDAGYKAMADAIDLSLFGR